MCLGLQEVCGMDQADRLKSGDRDNMHLWRSTRLEHQMGLCVSSNAYHFRTTPSHHWPLFREILRLVW